MMHEPGGATAEGVAEQPVADKLLVDLDIDIGPWLPDSLQPFWSFLQDYPLLLVLILAALGYVIGKALQWMLRQLLERITKRTRSDLDDRLTRYLTKPVVQTTVILALVAAVKSFGFDESADRFMVRALFSFLILLWGRAWFHAVTLVIGLMARDAQRFPAFQPRTRPLFEMGVKLVLLSIFIWLFMALWDIDGTAWLASAGVVGIAVGFAAKDTLANLFGGLFVIVDAPYKIGDFINLDSGERGRVVKIGLRSTRLLTRDDVEITLPNAIIANSKVINESGGPWEKTRVAVKVGVAYGSDVDRVRRVLMEAASTVPHVVPDPEPRIRFLEMGDSALIFRVMCWIDEPVFRGQVLDGLNTAIYKGLNEAEIPIPFPQRDVHLHPVQPPTP